MTPNEIISGLLAIARAAKKLHTLAIPVDAIDTSVGATEMDALAAALAGLDALPGEGDGVTRATSALQSFIESTGGNVAVPREVFAVEREGYAGVAALHEGVPYKSILDTMPPSVAAAIRARYADVDSVRLDVSEADIEAVRALMASRSRRVDPPQDRYAANTIYTVATDSTGKPVIYGSRSTSAPHEDTHIMEAALEFEQAKRLRGVEIQPHKVGHLWMTTIEPMQISHDFYTHRRAWHAAIQRCIDSAPPATADSDDKSYWEHELKAFNRTMGTLPQNTSHALRLYIPETIRDRLIAETTIAAQKIVGDAALLQNLRECCGFIENGTGEPVTICQDDATRDWGLHVGSSSNFAKRRSYHAGSFHQVIRIAYEKERQDHDDGAEALNLAQPRERQFDKPEVIPHFDHKGDLPPVGLAPKGVPPASPRVRMNTLLNEVKDKMGVATAKAIIRGPGGSPHHMADIPDDKIDDVIAKCLAELAAERDHEGDDE